MYLELGLRRKALDAFNQAVRVNPDNVKAHFTLGYMYSNFGLHKEAIEAYQQVIRIDPDNAKAHFNLGIEYLILDDREGALRHFKILEILDKKKADELADLINE
jgi:tetratricopeptide (TPR) repeat protein